MSRPRPNVVCSTTTETVVLEVCEVDCIYTVCFDGKPIKIKTRSLSDPYVGAKYPRNSWPEPGHAVRCARELNELFYTDLFTVKNLTTGREIKVTGSAQGDK